MIDDIRNLLGLDDPLPDYDRDGEDDEALFTQEDQEALERKRHQGPLSPTCLANLDEWDLEQGRDLAKRINYDDLAMADFHGAAYLGSPELAPVAQDARRWEFMNTLMNSPEFQALRRTTLYDQLASECAALKFAEQYRAMEQEEQARECRLLQSSLGKAPTAAQQRNAATGAALRAAGKALQAAEAEVEELAECTRSLGGMGGQDGRMDSAKVSKVFKRVKNNRQLKKICELAGAYRRFAQSAQRRKVQHGYDDIVGVELSGDLGRVLPLELAMLDDPDFELDAMRRLIERQSMSRQYRGVDTLAKGPIVVCVDESGSMDGDPVCNAKAFALAMAWIAQHQKRWCVLVGYSGSQDGHSVVLPPKKWNEQELLNWLEHFFGGGTEMDIPLEYVPQHWDKFGVRKGKADLIILTDAICEVPFEMERDFKAWKEREQVKCISLILESEPGDLAKISDRTYCMRGIGLDENGIQAALNL